MIYIAFITAYMVALVGVGFIRSRRVESQEDFAVAGRTLSTFVLFGTMVATWIGTGSIFGHAERTYEVGIAMLIMPLSDVIGITALTFLASRARNYAKITIQDILEERYGVVARLLGAITLIIATVTIVSYQYRAAGAVLNIAWPSLSLQTAVWIAVVFVIAYTAIAGMYSVAYTDLVMGLTMIVGILVTLPTLWIKAGGLQGMHAVLPSDHFLPFGPISWKEAMALLLPGALLVLGDANMYQRFFSARSGRSARRATIWMLFGVVYMDLMIIVTAWISSALEWNNPGLANHGRVIAYAARDFLPQALGAVMLTVIMAIILSTAISYLLVPATSLMRDVYQRFLDPQASPRRMVWLSRLAVVVLGLAAYYLSTRSSQFLSVALYAYTIYGTGITPALVAALVWKRATAAGGIASIVGGTGMTLVWELSGLAQSTGLDTVFPAISLSVLLLVLVSLATPRRAAISAP